MSLLNKWMGKKNQIQGQLQIHIATILTWPVTSLWGHAEGAWRRPYASLRRQIQTLKERNEAESSWNGGRGPKQRFWTVDSCTFSHFCLMYLKERLFWLKWGLCVRPTNGPFGTGLFVTRAKLTASPLGYCVNVTIWRKSVKSFLRSLGRV